MKKKETTEKEITKTVKKVVPKKEIAEEREVAAESIVEPKKIPVLYYVLVFLTVLSTLLIATAGVFNIELGNDYADIIKAQGAGQEYVDYYRKQNQTSAIYHLGIAGVVAVVGIYFSDRVRKADLQK